MCQGEYVPKSQSQKWCSKKCRTEFNFNVQSDIADPLVKANGVDLSTGTTGAVAELMVSADLMRHGWNVFRALSPHCFCDLVASKDGKIRYVEVRTAMRYLSGKLSFPTKIHRDATEYGLWVRNTGEIIYIPVPEA